MNDSGRRARNGALEAAGSAPCLPTSVSAAQGGLSESLPPSPSVPDTRGPPDVRVHPDALVPRRPSPLVVARTVRDPSTTDSPDD